MSAQPVATDSYLPALPAIAQTLGSASTSLTVFALAFGIGQLPMGSLADRFGRRQVLLIGLACYAVAALAGALAMTSMLTAARALQGFSMAAIWCAHALRYATCTRHAMVHTSWRVASRGWVS
ncbi:MFS transporter [Streptomyces sp. L7]